MPRVLLLEPNYKNKYPPMGLMKLSTYFRNLGYDVRFFKGDLRDLAVELLFEEYWAGVRDIELGEYTGLMREHIKTGKLAPFNDIPNFPCKQELRDIRVRYKNKAFPKFDIVGITTLFTFYWKETVETINEAKNFVLPGGRLHIGGIASSILSDKMFQDIGVQDYHKFPSEDDVREIIGNIHIPTGRIEAHLYIGLLDKPDGIFIGDSTVIDELPLDYSLLDEIDYTYPAHNAYFGYMTRGCVNRCSFCAVPRLEPIYRNYISMREQVAQVMERFGAQRDLLLLDNNVFASKCFNQIIDDIKELGFAKGATYNPPNEYSVAIHNIHDGYNVRTYIKKIIKLYDSIVAKLSETEQGAFYNSREELGLLYADTATTESVLAFDEAFAPLYNKFVYSKVNTAKGRVRYIDFNQGVDARLMTEAKMKKLAEVNIRPLRIAFDHWDVDPQKPNSRPIREIYKEAVERAAHYGIRDLSNYLLYNSDEDTPDDLYRRLKMNIKLCEDLDVSIYSFPMKYHPIDDPDYFNNRNFIGRAWNRKYIRAVQAILNSTHGKIGRGKSFFKAAFGKSLNQFHEILMMPEAFIIERHKYDRVAYGEYLNGGGTRKITEDDVRRCGGMTGEWRRKYTDLNNRQKYQAKLIIFANDFTDEAIGNVDDDIREVLMYYRIKRYDEIPEMLAND
jgi:hypothetical protein